MKKIIPIDATLHNLAKGLAYQLGDTLSGFTEKALTAYIEQQRGNVPTALPAITINQATVGRPAVKKQFIKRWPFETIFIDIELRGNLVEEFTPNEWETGVPVIEGELLVIKLHQEDRCYMPDNNETAALMLVHTCDMENPFVKDSNVALKLMCLDGQSNVMEWRKISVEPGDIDCFEPVNELAKAIADLPIYPRKYFSKYFLRGMPGAGFFVKYVD